LPRQRSLQRRRRRSRRRPPGDRLRAAWSRWELRRQEQRRPPAARPDRPDDGRRGIGREDRSRPGETGREVTWVGFPVAVAVGLFVVPAGVRGLRDAGLVRENYRGRALAFPLGAILATAALVALAPLAFLNDRGDLELLDPELRRWIPYLLG